MVDIAITTADGAAGEKISLSDDIFGLEPRADILHRVVRWQLARRQAGTHQTLGRSDIARTGKKMYKQKGTGRARHAQASAPQFRGGGRAFGPVVRSHAHELNKKFRALGLKHALSAKLKDQQIVVLESFSLAEPKTKALKERIEKLGFVNALIVDGAEVENNVKLAVRSVPYVDVLPVQGINVYDILRRDTLVLTKAAIDALEARFK
ncbi:50S ribosomal protein L4 [Methylopila jiangsuensis]|uniref:Large ribosomal subunit protein uL4 n=1 Tax=Methylopila jiangsuensis TaxID=586230 RepID=A0A9W6JH47_9HYPH|nr:50S ribosomal protein L4 [Methylopila jiangsuensis]MDR6284339.1 large subunit ribosomal protein L4 [Methylopila jiangsuensis]GLK76143.1 50S ribosomal protein L4 [Methylopila jiangsuensis]